MAVPEDSAAAHANNALQTLLGRARHLKPTTDINPPLPIPDFTGSLGLPAPPTIPRTHYFAAIEDAARSIYQSRCASTPITSPAFSEIWALLDILSVTGDQEPSQNDPALAWWLIEELLETQSIDGCRIVFDYLESRRERLTGTLFDKKQLIILRAFNELLRRLSRAEEAVFCGRVFVFLFQSFPLGARSSVNLKGDFHKENLTTFEEVIPETQVAADEALTAAASATEGGDDAMTGVETTITTTTTTDAKETEEKPISQDRSASASLADNIDALYPVFWTMQQAFSNPPDYFFRQLRLEEFKTTLEATLSKFRSVPKVNQAAADQRGVKRTAAESFSIDGGEDGIGGGEDEMASTFNPKYLTSRELFSLELSDLAFQRHILVQALILLDFLLSLTERNKKRLGVIANKNLQIEYTLSDADATWVHSIRRSISTYLTDGQLNGDQEGKYYHRMVETVLSRDKNWVRWKLEFCNQIRQPPVHSEDFVRAQNGVKRMCQPVRLRANVMGAMDLGFLGEKEGGVNGGGGMEGETMRSELPDASTLVRDVQNVDLDLEMASTEDEKRDLEDQKMSKTWRALRLMSKTKLNLFDKVDDGKNLECFLQKPVGDEEMVGEEGKASGEAEDQSDERADDGDSKDIVEGKDEEAEVEEDQVMVDEGGKPEEPTVAKETIPGIVIDS